MTPLIALPPTSPDQSDRARIIQMREVAMKFEAVFLTQVLDLAGVGESPEGFGGGAGEQAFRGELLREQGRILAEGGGIGLAEHILREMMQREGLTE
jgi:hypothetical protein